MKIRVTGVLIENNSLLLLHQDVDEDRGWSLPGGTLEEGESLEEGLVREMREETGLEVTIGELLYIADLIKKDTHVVHLTFTVKKVGGKIGDIAEGLDTREIKSVEYVQFSELSEKGFSDKFINIVKNDFPNKGSYIGPKSNIGL